MPLASREKNNRELKSQAIMPWFRWLGAPTEQRAAMGAWMQTGECKMTAGQSPSVSSSGLLSAGPGLRPVNVNVNLGSH